MSDPARPDASPELAARARALLDLHTAPEILVLANVWDVVSAQVVAGTDGVRALATASHSIAATFGFPDGENIPLNLHLDMVGLIVAAVDLPVTMDFEAGYGDAGETARRAIDSRTSPSVTTLQWHTYMSVASPVAGWNCASRNAAGHCRAG